MLQLIGVTFIVIQLLVLVAPLAAGVHVHHDRAAPRSRSSPRPLVWTIDWTRALPPFAAAYFSPATGSQFPLFPWMGFILLGAGLGQLYARWGASDLSAFASAP